MTRPADLLHLLADEHRDLTTASRSLRHLRGPLAADAVRRLAVRTVEHELAHRLLLHPVLRRDPWGCTLLAERRDEQLLLADRLRRVLATAGIVPQPHDRCRDGDPAAAFDLALVAHTDREEIVSFPHVRRLVRPGELASLLEARHQLREELTPRLAAATTPVADGRWATAPSDDLAQLLPVAEELVVDLAALETERPSAGAR